MKTGQELVDAFFNGEFRVYAPTLEDRAAVVDACLEYKPDLGTEYADQSWDIDEWVSVVKSSIGNWLALSSYHCDTTAEEFLAAIREVLGVRVCSMQPADFDSLL